jgi:hypothetical protein
MSSAAASRRAIVRYNRLFLKSVSCFVFPKNTHFLRHVTTGCNYNHSFPTMISRPIHNFPGDENLRMQQLALHLLSLESTLNYNGSLQRQPTNFIDSHRKLMKDAVRVIRYFNNPNHRHYYLSLMDTTQSTLLGNKLSPKDHPLTTLPAFISYSILKQVLFPHLLTHQHQFRSLQTGNGNEITVMIDLCFTTIQSLSRKDAKVDVSVKGHLSEELLRMLFPCSYIPSLPKSSFMPSFNRESPSVIVKQMQSRLIHAYNATINVWAEIASAKNMDASMSKEAALHAERLLLEMATPSIRQNDIHLKHIGSPAMDPSTDDEILLASLIQPDIISFNTVIKAWANYGRTNHYSQNTPLSARRQIAFSSKENETQSGGEEEDEYHYLFMVKGEKTKNQHQDTSTFSAERAEAILKLLEEMADSYKVYISPDSRSYDNVIEAWAKISHTPEAPRRAMTILENMIDRYYKAQSQASSLETVSKDEMTSNLPPFPSKYTFTACLKAWLFSKDPNSLAMMESILEKMNQFVLQGFDGCRPDIIMYNIIFTKYGKRLNGNIRRVESILKLESPSSLDNKTSKRRKELERLVDDQSEICQNIEMLYTRLCGGDAHNSEYALSMTSGNEDNDVKARSTHSQKVALMQLQPDEITYGTLVYSKIAHAQSLIMIRKRFNYCNYDEKILGCAMKAERFLNDLVNYPDTRMDQNRINGRTVKAPSLTTVKEIIDIYVALGDYDRASSLITKCVELMKRGKISEGSSGITHFASELMTVIAKQGRSSGSSPE